MIFAKVKVSDFCAMIEYRRTIPTGLIGGEVAFEFIDPLWDALDKFVVFESGHFTKVDVLEGNLAIIPPEAVAKGNEGNCLKVGVFGTDAENGKGVPTFWANLGKVRDAADPMVDPNASSSLPIWATIMAKVEALESGGPVSEDVLKQITQDVVEEYLEENPIETPDLTDQVERAEAAAASAEAVKESVGTSVNLAGGYASTAHSSANRAEQASNGAQEYASSALSSAMRAEEAVTAAETAKQGAINAQSAAMGAIGLATTQANNAADSATRAEKASTDAENAAKRAEEAAESILDSGGNVDYVGVEPAYDDIPKIFFGGALQQTKDEAVVPFRYISKTDDFSGYAEIKAQGNSSMNYAKKNQTVKMFKDEACDSKMKVDFKGWGKQNKHVYKANWIDLTHARNIVSARLWADVVKSRANYADLPELLRTTPNQGAIDGFPVKVYAAGVYQGRYTLNIPKDKWTFNMDDELDEHCALCGENYGSGCFRAAANINGSDWSDEIHDVVPASIKTRWNQVISFVMNSTDDEFRANLNQYFYVDSLIDYYLFGLASCGLDAFGKNQIYATYDGQRWIASMYDMDATWGLYWNGNQIVATDYPRTSYEDWKNGGNLLYIRLEQLFWAELQTRWAELKNGALSIENIINRFERFTDIAPAELVAEDYASTTGGGKFTGIPSKTTNNIQQIRAFALARQAWTDEYVAGLTPEIPVPCEGITLDNTALTFTAEGTQTITATVVPDGCTDSVIWASSNPAVAVISVDGHVCTVEAIANGSATITATCGDYSASCSVAVSGIAEPVPCTGITLDKTELVFNGDGAQTLVATVTPTDTTDKIVWVSDNTAAATVNNGVVTAVANGSATITANCGSQSASCSVTVSGIEVAYRLSGETSFNGTSDYIDTGVKLFDESKDFTVFLDFMPADTQGDAATVFCLLNETSPYPGITVRLVNGVLQTTSGRNNITVPSGNVLNKRVKYALVYSSATNDISVVSVMDDIPYVGGVIGTVSTLDQTALLGCAYNSNYAQYRFFNGTIYGCEIYGRAFDPDEIYAKLGVIREDITWSKGFVVNASGAVVTGNNYVSDPIELPEGTTNVNFSNVGPAHFSYMGIWEYDENQNFIRGTDRPSGSATSYNHPLTLQENTKYIRLTAYPKDSNATDPNNQLVLFYLD